MKMIYCTFVLPLALALPTLGDDADTYLGDRPSMLEALHRGVGESRIVIDPPQMVPTESSGSLAVAGYNSSGAVGGTNGQQGICRSIWIVDVANAAGLQTNAAKINLQVFVDYGYSSNRYNANFRTWNVPLSDLFGCRYRYATNWVNVWQYRDSKFIWSEMTWTNHIMGFPTFAIDLKFPHYFTNGFCVALSNTVSGVLVSNIYIGLDLERLTLPRALAKWRSYAFATSGVPVVGSNYFFSVAGRGFSPGYIVALKDNNAGVATATDSKSLRFVSSGRTNEAIGLDDDLGHTFAMSSLFRSEANATNWFSGHTRGVMNYYSLADSSVAWFEAYRWRPSNPITWTNGAVCSFPDAVELQNWTWVIPYYLKLD